MSLFDHIDNIQRECSKPGWDSYAAEPISKETAELAKKILHAILEMGEAASVAPTTTGALLFEGGKPKGEWFQIEVNTGKDEDVPTPP
jgi:hypothetical protein